MLLKQCRTCSLQRPLMYYKNHGHTKDGLRLDCQDCEEIYKRRMSFYDSNKRPKHKTEEEMLGNYYPEFCRRIIEYRKTYEIY